MNRICNGSVRQFKKENRFSEGTLNGFEAWLTTPITKTIEPTSIEMQRSRSGVAGSESTEAPISKPA